MSVGQDRDAFSAMPRFSSGRIGVLLMNLGTPDAGQRGLP